MKHINIIINADSPDEVNSPITGYHNFYHNVLAALGFDRNQPPVAKLLSELEDLNGNWIIASPIYWRASNNDAQVILTDDNLVKKEDNKIWFEVLANFLELLQPKIHNTENGYWLININESFKTMPSYTLINKPIMLFMPDLSDKWKRIFTESQMYLSNHPLNQERQYPVNGFWFWGDTITNVPLKTNQKIYYASETAYDLVTFYQMIVKNLILILCN